MTREEVDAKNQIETRPLQGGESWFESLRRPELSEDEIQKNKLIEMSRMEDLAELARQNVKLAPLLQIHGENWFAQQEIEDGVWVDVEPITQAMINGLTTIGSQREYLVGRLYSAQTNYEYGDDTTVNDLFNINRPNILTDGLGFVNKMAGYQYMSADNPFHDTADNKLRQVGTTIANLRITNLDMDIVMPDQSQFQEYSSAVLRSDYDRVASLVFDLRAVMAARKRIGGGGSEIGSPARARYAEVATAFQLMGLALTIFDGMKESAPADKVRDRLELGLINTELTYPMIEDMDLVRLRLFIGDFHYKKYFD